MASNPLRPGISGQQPKQFTDRLPSYRVHQSRRNLGERPEYETPGTKPRMRQLQHLGVDYQIPDKQKVKIERARRPDSRPDTTAFALDPQQSGQQRFRWRGRRPHQCAIQKTGTVNAMLRLGVDKARHPDVSQDVLETRNREREMRGTTPEITPKRHRHGSG